jgi:hypothetical protein
MKRHAIALLVHPCKDCLLPRKILTERLNELISALVESGAAFQNIKVNLVLPGFFLELLDPLLLLKLREMHKRSQLEWLFTGYTEPFVSFSPPWLLGENLKHGITSMNDLAGAAPTGLVLPFSNWEPSAIDLFKAAKVQYGVVSKALFPLQFRRLCGYWLTEHMGSTMALFPALVVAQSGFSETCAKLESLFWEDTRSGTSGKIICLDVIYSLSPSSRNSAADLTAAFHALDKLLLTYQTVRCGEFLSSHFSLGLIHLASGLVLARDHAEGRPDFLNELHSFDHVGLLQRKMMDIAENIASRKETKDVAAAKKNLFFVQDISHFLPSAVGGFLQAQDRQWCYSKMIEIERNLFAGEDIVGGHIRITDLLRNGNKTIVMANKNLSLCIDYKNGGQVFEIDFKPRNFNLCAAPGPRHRLPMIVDAPYSKTAFLDHCLALETGIEDFSRNRFRESGDFLSEDFGYKVKKTSTGIKTVLLRNGTLLQGEKNCPLTVEKALGLEKDSSLISFAYQLSNNSLTPYAFRFGMEMTISLPGLGSEMASIIQGKTVHTDLGDKSISMERITEWVLEDTAIGMRISFAVQKPMDVWCFPLRPEQDAGAPAQAMTLFLSMPVSLEGAQVWGLMGSMELKKIRARPEALDEI